jgi:hypothetical protein
MPLKQTNLTHDELYLYIYIFIVQDLGPRDVSFVRGLLCNGAKPGQCCWIVGSFCDYVYFVCQHDSLVRPFSHTNDVIRCSELVSGYAE